MTAALPGAVGPAPADLLLALAVVCAAAWAGGRVARSLRQPAVVGQILAGIALGPSLLGAAWPGLSHAVFPPSVLAALGAVAQVGLVLFMFLVGAELDPGHLRGHGRRAVVVSQAGIAVPLALGVLLGLVSHRWIAPEIDRLPFALFLGVAMAITAFPVLASILREAGLLERPIGVLAMTCAAIDDVTAWVVLAAVVAVAESSGAGSVLRVLLLLGAYVAVALGAVRPMLARLPRLPLALCVAMALGSAWITEVVGVHAIFGAFVAGAVLPRGALAPRIERMEPLVDAILLPTFFVVAGFSVRLGLVDGAAALAFTAAVLVVAVAGKLGGCYAAARLTGATNGDALALGIMMNTRGLTEVVILTVGLELGVIDERVFSVMVLMAVVTTVAARPALDSLGRRTGWAVDGVEGAPPSCG